MADKPKTNLFPSWSLSYSLVAQPSNPVQPTTSPIEAALKARHHSFYGAVFNALDDYLRRGHGYALPHHAIKTDFLVDNDDAFYLQIIPAHKSDALENDPVEVVKKFIEEVSHIVDLHEIDGACLITDHDKAEDQTSFTFRLENKFDLLQIAEQLLKPYDMGDSFLPAFHMATQHTEDVMPFSFFPQYSLKHIRAMFMMTQGRASEVQGIHLNH